MFADPTALDARTVQGTKYPGRNACEFGQFLYSSRSLLSHLQNGTNVTFPTHFKRCIEETREIMPLTGAVQIKCHIWNQHNVH